MGTCQADTDLQKAQHKEGRSLGRQRKSICTIHTQHFETDFCTKRNLIP